MKKEKLNNELYKTHSKLAKEWSKSWHIIEESLSESLNRELEQKYKKMDGKNFKNLANSQNKNKRQFRKIPADNKMI
jgi:hypothetical protein